LEALVLITVECPLFPHR